VADTHGSGSANGKKAVIQAIAIGAAAFVEQMLTELLQRLLGWTQAYHRRRAEERRTRARKPRD